MTTEDDAKSFLDTYLEEINKLTQELIQLLDLSDSPERRERAGIIADRMTAIRAHMMEWQ